MKKRLAVFLTMVLLLCALTPLCSACGGTWGAPAGVPVFVSGIGWTYFSRLFPCRNAGGTFTFTVYGQGHGVGMSQRGADAYARQGWSYDRILQHYYPGVSLERETPLAVMTYGGKTRDTEDFLVRAVQQEMGTDAGAEAYKAQAVAVYSMLKSKNYALTSADVSCSAAAKGMLSADIRSAVRSVRGLYMSFEGKAVHAVFHACCAGRTTDSQSVWGEALPYLAGGADSPETVSVSVSAITAKGLRTMVRRYNAAHPDQAITLSGDPAHWLQILSGDGARDDAGYVSSIRLGSATMSGYRFRTLYNQYRPYGTAALRSHCFSVQYA